MPKDGLRRLPDHVVPLMLRVLMTIPRTPDRRLVLRKPDEPRLTAEALAALIAAGHGGDPRTADGNDSDSPVAD